MNLCEWGRMGNWGKRDLGITELTLLNLVMAIFVVVLHTHPFYGIDDTLNFVTADVVGRIAVPFFFAATGFCWRKGKRKELLMRGKE